MLTGWRVQVYFVPKTVCDFQTFYQSDIQPLYSKISEERMANLRTLKYFDILPINFNLHLILLCWSWYGLSTLLLSLGSQLFQLVFALEGKHPDEEASQHKQ